MSKLKMGRDFLTSNLDLRSMKPEQISGDRLLELTINISKHQLCSVPQSSTHLWRTLSLLWRIMICGNGEPDLVWANPSAPIPLRVHAFATLLHLIGSTSMYLSKNGVTLVDGVSSWNVVTLGRVIALTFDEQKLFGTLSTELLDEDLWSSKGSSETRSSTSSPSERQRRRRHTRTNYDIFNDMPPRDETISTEFISSQAGALHSPSRSPKRGGSPGLDAKEVWRDELIREKASNPESPKRPIKLDTKLDFQSALRSVASDDDSDGMEDMGVHVASSAMLQAFGENPSGNRRWMTLPSRGLSTIKESTDDNDELEAVVDEGEMTETVARSRKDPGEEEPMIKTMKKNVKQMRVPRSRSLDKAKSQTLPTEQLESALKSQDQTPLVPKTDEEIESAGSAFLEAIGKSIGVR